MHATCAVLPYNHFAPLTLVDSSDAARERLLITRAREGDRDAFGTLVRLHIDAVMRTATRILRNAADAEDVVQDAFLSALRNLDEFDDRRRFGPWLSRIVVNRALDVVSSRRVRDADALTRDIGDRGPLPDARAAESELISNVRRVTSRMPPRQRLILELHHLEGLSVAEIAESTGAAQATVRWHLHMGHRILRSALSRLYGDRP